jgi:hypothetical protein
MDSYELITKLVPVRREFLGFLRELFLFSRMAVLHRMT